MARADLLKIRVFVPRSTCGAALPRGCASSVWSIGSSFLLLDAAGGDGLSDGAEVPFYALQ